MSCASDNDRVEARDDGKTEASAPTLSSPPMVLVFSCVTWVQRDKGVKKNPSRRVALGKDGRLWQSAVVRNDDYGRPKRPLMITAPILFLGVVCEDYPFPKL
jgi:hypothetical protein